MKSWRPRFSLRTLAILVTLACAYFGAWEATKQYGVPAVQWHVRHPIFIGPDGNEYTLGGAWYYYDTPMALAPFVLTVPKYVDALVEPNGGEMLSGTPRGWETYLWFFGFIYPRTFS